MSNPLVKTIERLSELAMRTDDREAREALGEACLQLALCTDLIRRFAANVDGEEYRRIVRESERACSAAMDDARRRMGTMH